MRHMIARASVLALALVALGAAPLAAQNGLVRDNDEVLKSTKRSLRPSDIYLLRDVKDPQL